MHSPGPYAYADGTYKPAEVYQYHDGLDMGIELVFEQHLGNGHPAVWHINPDMIMALRLLKEGDKWICPDDGYIDVIRQHIDDDGRVRAILIRAEYLRDYLAARVLALRIVYYRQRIATLTEAPDVSWATERLEETKPNERFVAHVFEVDEDGAPYGSSVGLFHVWRTDVHDDDDVPEFGPEADGNTDGSSSSYRRGGNTFFRVEGELWREEWIEPSERSEKVRDDKPIEQLFYTVDAAGKREGGDHLNDQDIGKYLWFDPKVVLAIANRRGGSLDWYTEETGSASAFPIGRHTLE